MIDTYIAINKHNDMYIGVQILQLEKFTRSIKYNGNSDLANCYVKIIPFMWDNTDGFSISIRTSICLVKEKIVPNERNNVEGQKEDSKGNTVKHIDNDVVDILYINYNVKGRRVITTVHSSIRRKKYYSLSININKRIVITG